MLRSACLGVPFAPHCYMVGSVFLHSALCPIHPVSLQPRTGSRVPDKEPFLSFSVSPTVVYNQSRYGVQPGHALPLSLPQPWTRHWCVGVLDPGQWSPHSTARWQRADAMKGSVLALQLPYHFTGQSPVLTGNVSLLPPQKDCSGGAGEGNNSELKSPCCLCTRPSSVPSTRVTWLTIICNSSSRNVTPSSSLHEHQHTHSHKMKIHV